MLGFIGKSMDPVNVETDNRGFRSILRRIEAMIEAINFHCHSVWLFTSSDLKTVVGPSFVFGATNALARVKKGLEYPKETLGTEMLHRLPLVLLWIWVNLLPFTINNQKTPDAIKEDEMNKPWRTLPSRPGRMTPRQAEGLMLVLYPLAVGLSWLTGGVRQSVGLIVLSTWYNNFGGGDTNFFVRNLMNACVYVCFTSSAIEVTLGFPVPLETRIVRWFGVVAAIILTTVHLQDMYDQIGDSLRGRKTVPLIIGDVPARWTIAIVMVFWGGFCPCYWNGRPAVAASSHLLASTVAARSLLFKTVEGDRLTFKIWNAWMMLVFVSPLKGRGSS